MTLTGMALRALAPAALLSTVALAPVAASAASPLAGHVLTYATRNVNGSVQMGRFRSQHATENWTLSLAGA